MVLRSMLGSALVMGVMGFAPNVGVFIFLRIMQGILAGTVAAASSLVASTTPRDKLTKAMGLLMVAVYVGSCFGPLAGGYLHDILGYQFGFLMVGIILLLTGLAVLFLVKEKFQPPATNQGSSFSSIKRLILSREVMPLLICSLLLAAATSLFNPILSLIFSDMLPGLSITEQAAEAARYAGIAFFLVGVLSAVSSVTTGRLGSRLSLRNIIVICGFGLCVLFLPPILAATPAQMVLFVGLTGIFSGAMITATSSMLGLSVPLEQQGLAYGISQSITSLGGSVGPFIGGPMAAAIGLRSPFYVSCALALGIGILFLILVKKKPVLAPQRDSIYPESE